MNGEEAALFLLTLAAAQQDSKSAKSAFGDTSTTTATCTVERSE